MISKRESDMAAEESLDESVSSEVDPALLYPVESYVDIMEAQGSWRVAQILEHIGVEKCYRVCYVTSKLEERVPFRSERLAPFRTKTVCLPGPKNIVNPRQNQTFKLAQFTKKLQQIQNFLERPLSSFAPESVVQLLRGSHYLYCEYLLTNTYQDPQNLKKAIQYLRLHISLVCRYLNTYYQVLRKVEAEPDCMVEETPDDHKLVKYLEAFPQILQLSIGLFGGIPRHITFIRDNKSQLQQYLDVSHREQQITDAQYFSLLFGPQFMRQSGVQCMTNLFLQLHGSNFLIDFSLLKYLFAFYGSIAKMGKTDIRQKCRFSILHEITAKNINKLTEKEIKVTTRHSICQVIRKLREISEGTYEQNENAQACQQLQLDAAVKYLKSPFFKSKLQAICGLKQKLEGIVELTSKNTENGYTSQMFYEWFLRSKLLQYLLTDSTHSQILKKTLEIIKLFCRAKILDKSTIDMLWTCRVGKHQVFIRQIQQSLVLLVSEMAERQELIEHISSRILSVDCKDWDDDYLEFVKSFTLRAIKTLHLADRIYGMYAIYQYYLHSKSQTALSALDDILRQDKMQQSRNNIIKKCLNSIEKDGEDSFEHIKLLNICVERDLPQDCQAIVILILKNIKKHGLNSETLEARLNLLHSLLNNTPSLLLRKEDIHEIWNITRANQKSFSILLKRLVEEGRTNGSIVSVEVRNFIFFDLIGGLSNDQIACMNPMIFLVFHTYFKEINDEFKCLELYDATGKFTVVDPSGYRGIDTLWRMLFHCNEYIFNRICEFMIALYTNINTKYDKFKEAYGALLVETTMGNIQSDINNYVVVARSLDLLKRLIDRVEPKIETPRNSSDFFKRETETIRKGSGEVIPRPPSFPPSASAGIPHNNYIKRQLQKRMALLLQLLSTKAAQKAWVIADQLPLSEDCFKILQNFQRPIEHLFEGGIFRELYVLQLIVQRKDPVWWQSFLQHSGISTLLTKLSKDINNYVDENYFYTLTSILSRHFSERPQEHSSAVNNKILHFLERYLIFLLKKMKNPHKDVQPQKERIIFKNCFSILNKNRKDIIVFPNLFNLLKTLLKYDGTVIKKLVFAEVREAIANNWSSDEAKKLVASFFVEIYELVAGKNGEQPVIDKPTFYFIFCKDLIALSLKNEGLSSELENALPSLLQNIYQTIVSTKYEKSSDYPNDLLAGSIEILSVLINYFPNSADDDLKMNILQYTLQVLLFDCLSQNGPKCKQERSRFWSFQLIDVLIKRLANATTIFCDFIHEALKKGSWRTYRSQDWKLTGKINERSHTGYVGIDNPGCICYMISFFQQMFMIPSLRLAILESDDPQFNKVDRENNVLYQLKALFVGLQRSNQECLDPRQFCNAFKNQDGNPTNVYQQMDVYEFTNVLFDRLESQLKGTRNFVNQHFGGVISNQIICKDCPHSSEREQPFLSLSLQVKNKKNLQQSFEAMVKSELLAGQNSYDCQQCKKKVRALKRVSLKRLPNHLIIVLKRIQFNFQLMCKTKIDQFCQFQTSIDLKQFSQQHLHTIEGKQLQNVLPDDYFQYDLKGTIVHMGYADNGHYYSIIRQRSGEQKWFQFNDNMVKSFDPTYLSDQCFGGENEATKMQKRKSSYVLIYDRKQMYAGSEKMHSTPHEPIYRHCEELVEAVRLENERKSQQRMFFSKDIMDFFKQLTNSIQRVKKLEETHSLLFKTCIIFGLTVVIRHLDIRFSTEYLGLITQCVSIHQDFSVWVMRLLSQPQLIRQLFAHNPNSNIRRILAFFLIEINQICYTLHYDTSDDSLEFIKSILSVATDKTIFWYCPTNQLFLIVYKILQYSPTITSQLLSMQITSRLMLLLSGEQIPHNHIELKNDNKSDKFMQLCNVDTDGVVGCNNKHLESKVYVWCLLEKLLTQCSIGANVRPYKAEGELELILQTNLSVIEEEPTKLQIRKMASVFCYLATENKTWTEKIIEQIKTVITQSNQCKYRTVYGIYKKLLQINDSLTAYRLASIGDIISIVAREAEPADAEVSQQYILKIVRKNQNLHKYLACSLKCREMMRAVKDQISRIPDIIRERCDVLKSMHQLHGIKLPKKPSLYRQLLDYRYRYWDGLLKGYIQSVKCGWESDEDVAQNEELERDTGIFILNSWEKRSNYEHDYCSAVIKEVKPDELVLMLENGKLIHVERDSEQLTLNVDIETEESERSERSEESEKQSKTSEEGSN